MLCNRQTDKQTHTHTQIHNGTSFVLSYQREVVRSLRDGATPQKKAAAYNASLLDRGVDSGDSAAAQRKYVYLANQA